MKVLVAGDITRGEQWETYLRSRLSVSEVIVASEFRGETVDAVILLDQSHDQLEILLEIVKKVLPVFLVSSLHTDRNMLQKVYHASEEAGVPVQFSHWSSYSSMSRWIRKHLNSAPRFIEIQKHDRNRSVPDRDDFRRIWRDELAVITSWQKSTVQQITAHPIQLTKQRIGIHCTIRFDNGAVGVLNYHSVSPADSHQRTFQNRDTLIHCDILSQKSTRYTPIENSTVLNSDHRTFDPHDSAENSVDSFIRSIKSDKPGAFSIADALQAARVADRVEELLKRV
ncbi:hypothetical protein DYD21_19120 [Rhodohalobacter sp. SW132]|uniref:hypothetical protein n=1 Tax=Rhodohalobacter sp. SW132 TaxID=2293433 RepID=UPI000E27256E|nr:hypothetical protein [Rhodohalobacter sp. SW132]REL24319.1 hypothetical protein DYD21_19120 [Rhodohalobacter sp. SW132]